MKRRYTLRLLLLVVTAMAVALALDQRARSTVNNLKEEMQRNPRQFVTQIELLPGNVTIELDGIREQTTFLNRATGRRRLAMFYSAVAQDGNHFTNVQGTERFDITFGAFHQIPQNY